MDGNERSLLETCGLCPASHGLAPSVPSGSTQLSVLQIPCARKACFQDACGVPSFLERIAFAEAALWGHACAAPDSGVTLFIAPLRGARGSQREQQASGSPLSSASVSEGG